MSDPKKDELTITSNDGCGCALIIIALTVAFNFDAIIKLIEHLFCK